MSEHAATCVQEPVVLRIDGQLYRRLDGPFSAWRFLSAEERRVRMREYMRYYRWRKRHQCLNK